MNVLILKKFNNYANRIVIRYETLLDYEQRASSFLTFSNINFNPNDGVMTELVVGSETQQQPGVTPGTTTLIDWDKNGAPDYLVCFEEPVVEESGSDDSSDEPIEVIVSRWFITECVRTRSGQYHLTLKRDSIADHLTEVEDATCFIEKGIIENNDDPAVYNKESITTNQIKSDEYLLKDESQCGWIVGYVARDRDDGAGHLVPTTFTEQSIPGPDASDSACSEIYSTEDAFWAAHPELLGDLASLNYWKASVNLDVWYGRFLSIYQTGQIVSCANTGIVTYEETGFSSQTGLYSVKQGDGNLYTAIWKAWLHDAREFVANNLVANWKTSDFNTEIISQIEAKENIHFVDQSALQSFFNYIKRQPVIKIGSRYYIPYDKYGDNDDKSTVSNKLNLTPGSTAFDLFNNNINRTPEVEFTYLDFGKLGHTDKIEGTPNSDTFALEWSYNRHSLGLREIFSECKAKLPANVPVLKDAPYHMFAIPFSDDLTLYNGNTLHCVTNKSVAMNAAQALAQKSGVGVVYDVQLLPYCPVRDIFKTEKVTAHAEFTIPEEDSRRIIIETIPGHHTLAAGSFFKLNKQYTLSKNITWTRTLGQNVYNQYGFALKSDGTIYIKVGTNNIENPTSIYTCKRFEIIKPNNDASEDAKIRLYSIKEPSQSDTPIVEFSYNSYVSGDDVIGIYLTSNFSQGGYGENYSHIVGWEWLSNTGIPYTILGAKNANPKLWTTGYIYYEDYYLTKVDIANAITSDIVTMINGTETDIVNTIFWCTDSQFSFNKYIDNYFLLQADGTYKQDIVTELLNEKVKLPSDITEMKVRGQTDMIRLASPNYSNFFDINVIQNRGIEYINVDCTYKPYQPYLHLNPNFKGLYGADYNDIRGLICGGDFSIATTTDAWATYQLQNKNYQAIFDRQMQQLETQHGIQHDINVMNAITGVGTATVGGAVSGALTGAKVGGGYGAIAGAVVGGVGGLAGSTFGGAIDVSNADRLMELQRSTMKDIYYMQLDNIKALPLGLAKTSYLTNNNKLFPFLEFYTCTATEDIAVRDYLDYNGMTINRIGKIRDFQDDKQLPYIKAKLIRIDIDDDPHQVTAISSELATGVYLPEGDSDVVEGE